eukprot:SM000020S06108  [mRNA]  locus=s20:1091165:1095979:- [translate_table: standard]
MSSHSFARLSPLATLKRLQQSGLRKSTLSFEVSPICILPTSFDCVKGSHLYNNKLGGAVPYSIGEIASLDLLCAPSTSCHCEQQQLHGLGAKYPQQAGGVAEVVRPILLAYTVAYVHLVPLLQGHPGEPAEWAIPTVHPHAGKPPEIVSSFGSNTQATSAALLHAPTSTRTTHHCRRRRPHLHRHVRVNRAAMLLSLEYDKLFDTAPKTAPCEPFGLLLRSTGLTVCSSHSHRQCDFAFLGLKIKCRNPIQGTIENDPASQGCIRAGCKEYEAAPSYSIGLCQYLPVKDGKPCLSTDPNPCHNNNCQGGVFMRKNAPGKACTANTSSIKPAWNEACYQASCSSTGYCTQITFSNSSTICQDPGVTYPDCKISHCSGVDGICGTALVNKPDGTICTTGSNIRECLQNTRKSGACTGLLNRTDHTPTQTYESDVPSDLLGPNYPHSQGGLYEFQCLCSGGCCVGKSYFTKGTFCGSQYTCGFSRLFQSCPACGGKGSCTDSRSDGESCTMCNGCTGYYICDSDYTCDYIDCSWRCGLCNYNV